MAKNVDYHFCKSVGFRLDPEDLEPILLLAKKERVPVTHLVKQFFLEGFARWQSGEFSPEITRAARRRFPASSTAMHVDDVQSEVL